MSHTQFLQKLIEHPAHKLHFVIRYHRIGNTVSGHKFAHMVAYGSSGNWLAFYRPHAEKNVLGEGRQSLQGV